MKRVDDLNKNMSPAHRIMYLKNNDDGIAIDSDEQIQITCIYCLTVLN